MNSLTPRQQYLNDLDIERGDPPRFTEGDALPKKEMTISDRLCGQSKPVEPPRQG